MGMTAEDDVDPGDAARELEVDVHAVMRQQQHGVGLVVVAQAVDHFLQLVVADAECPVRREAPGMGDRHIGKGLADHRDAEAADVAHQGRLEHAPRRGIERLGVVELRLFGEEYVLRQELALEAVEIGAQRLLAIGEFPMTGHRLDAEQVRRLDHVGALRGVGESRALPEIATVEQHRTARSDVVPQAIDQRFQMGKAAELAEARRGLLEID